jgi:transposase-like protein
MDHYLTPAEVAERLGVDRSYVYRHWRALGGRKLPGGPKAHLRFRWADVEASMTPVAAEEGRIRRQVPSRRRRRESDVQLLPVRGQPLVEEDD